MKARVISLGYLRGAEIVDVYPKDMIVNVLSSTAKYIPAELLVKVDCRPQSRFSFYRKRNKD